MKKYQIENLKPINASIGTSTTLDVDPTLFTKCDNKDILLVQIYIDDIIFGSTKLWLCKEFFDLMTKEFKMSLMGELNFFLGL